MDTKTDNKNGRKKRGTNWSDKETRTMLEIATEMKINKLMDANKYRHIDIYKALERKLEERGVHKTYEQIKIRLKKLKSSYFNCKKDNAPSGVGRTDIPFYDQLDLLFGTRPAVESNLDGVDTLEMEESDIPTVSEAYEIEPNVIIEEIVSPINQSEEIIEVENLENIPTTSKQGAEQKNKASGGRYTSNVLLQNFATTMKKNWQEISDKMTKDHEQFMAKEMKKQRDWDVKLVKLQLKSQERQTNKLINVLTNLRSKRNETPAQSDSSEDAGSADLLDSDLSDL